MFHMSGLCRPKLSKDGPIDPVRRIAESAAGGRIDQISNILRGERFARDQVKDH